MAIVAFVLRHVYSPYDNINGTDTSPPAVLLIPKGSLYHKLSTFTAPALPFNVGHVLRPMNVLDVLSKQILSGRSPVNVSIQCWNNISLGVTAWVIRQWLWWVTQSAKIIGESLHERQKSLFTVSHVLFFWHALNRYKHKEMNWNSHWPLRLKIGESIGGTLTSSKHIYQTCISEFYFALYDKVHVELNLYEF